MRKSDFFLQFLTFCPISYIFWIRIAVYLQFHIYTWNILDILNILCGKRLDPPVFNLSANFTPLHHGRHFHLPSPGRNLNMIFGQKKGYWIWKMRRKKRKLSFSYYDLKSDIQSRYFFLHQDKRPPCNLATLSSHKIRCSTPPQTQDFCNWTWHLLLWLDSTISITIPRCCSSNLKMKP